MGMPLLEKCYFGIDLKNGNIILGHVNLVLSFGLFITMAVVTAEVSTVSRDAARPIWFLINEKDIQVDSELRGLYNMSAILVVLFLVKFVCDIFFIYGVYLERIGIIKSYYIMWVTFFLLSMIVLFSQSYYYGIITIFIEVFYIAINVYMAFFSYSYCVQIKTREEA